MTTKWDIDRWVKQQVSVPHVKGFYPSLPAKELDIGIIDVIERLQYLVQDSCLKPNVEVRCPHCLSTVYRGGAQKCVSEMHCQRCDIAFEVEADDIIPFYTFTDAFKESMAAHRGFAEKCKKKVPVCPIVGEPTTLGSIMNSCPGQQIVIHHAIFGSNNVLAETYVNNDLKELGNLLKEIEDGHAREQAQLIKAQLEKLCQPATQEEEKRTCLKILGSLFGKAFKVGTFIYSNYGFLLAAYNIAKPFAATYGISLPDLPVINT